MHKTGWHLDLRIVFTPSFEHEQIPNLVYNLDQLIEKKFEAIVSWVLKCFTAAGKSPFRMAVCHGAGGGGCFELFPALEVPPVLLLSEDVEEEVASFAPVVPKATVVCSCEDCSSPLHGIFILDSRLK